MCTVCIYQPEPDFSYSMFGHGLTELFVGGAGGAEGSPNHDGSIQVDDLQQVTENKTTV